MGTSFCLTQSSRSPQSNPRTRGKRGGDGWGGCGERWKSHKEARRHREASEGQEAGWGQKARIVVFLLFFGGFGGTTSVMTGMQRARRATGHAPLRGRDRGWPADNRNGRRNFNPATCGWNLCGWFMRKHASKATLCTFPPVLSIFPSQTPHRHHGRRTAPPGGGCWRAVRHPGIGFSKSHPPSLPVNARKSPGHDRRHSRHLPGPLGRVRRSPVMRVD